MSEPEYESEEELVNSRSADEVSAPVLRFRLPGTWHTIDLADTEATKSDAKKMAEEILGRSDEAAAARILLRRHMADIAESGAEARGRVLFIADELAPGISLPATLTVFEPEGLRMSPAIGTDPEEVLRIFRAGLEELSTPGVEQAQIIEGDGFLSLRIHRIDVRHWQETPWEGPGQDPALAPETAWAWSDEVRAEAEKVTMRDILVDYWVTVPGSKSLVLVSAMSSCGDMPHAMLGLFDAIIAASYFEVPPPQADERVVTEEEITSVEPGVQ